MSVGELVVLGTASQVPTRTRSHHGAYLRFAREGILFDPGEGTQRQMILAGVSVSRLTRVCITHAHGDHLLGLPGVVQGRALDEAHRRLPIHFPDAARPYVERLCEASVFDGPAPVELQPTGPGPVDIDGPLSLRAAELSHSVPTLGWRVTEPDGRRMLPDRAAAAGVHGSDRARLQREGHVRLGGRTVTLEEVSTPRRGQSVAFVMDTRRCPGALELAADADLLVIEATFLETERSLAEESGHLTAGQAARLGRDAGARRVVLTHFSQRYPDLDGHLEEARLAAPDVDIVVARDLDRIAVPERP